MRYNLIKSMIMPGGWHYEQNGFTITAEYSFDQLVENVTHYRIQNGIDVGDVLKDVTEWICTNFPRQCNIINSDFGSAPISNDTQANLDAITQWAHIKAKSNPRLVDSTIAEQRAYKCFHCPQNKVWAKTGCQSCIGNMQRLMISIRQNKDVSYGADLGGCNMLKHDNRTAVWIEDNNTIDNLPGHCWCRKA
jgi:hypothetical protein